MLPWLALAGALLLILAAVLVQPLTGWDVRARAARVPLSETLPPWHGHWDPRVGPGTAPAVALALLGVTFGGRLAERWRFPALLALAYAVSLAWLLSLALVDGLDGLSRVLAHPSEYLLTAREVSDVGQFLRGYVQHIPIDSPDNWPIHIAGHPPGMALFFVLLVRVGLGGSLAAGVVVTVIAATVAPAVMLVLRILGAETAARRAAPFLVLSPAAVTMAVSADAVMAAVAAWAMVCLALATRRPVGWPLGWSVPAGLLFGCLVMMSYGLPVFAVTALGLLVAARNWRPLVPCAVSAAAVVGGFAVAGFAWWEAFPALVDRYWAGIASERPESYWIWANLALLLVTAGPALAPALTTLPRLPWEPRTLAVGAVVTVGLADLSLMSKAEVERIWLPFVPWLLIATAGLPDRWRRPALALQVLTALLVQHLVDTFW